MICNLRTPVLLLALAVMGCGASVGDTASTSGGDFGIDSTPTAGAAGAKPTQTQPDVDVVDGQGSAGSQGIGGSDSLPTAGAGGNAGTTSAELGGAGGASAGSGGSGSAGAGSAGAAQGGAGGQAGSAQGGSSGSGNPPPPPAPACTFDLDHDGPGTRCSGLLFETCTLVDGVAEYSSTQCGTADVGFQCDNGGGCVGECKDGNVRCTGDTAEACAYGVWETSEVCPFQCVNGACEGACTPGDTHCDGSSVVTCGQDFHFGNPVACPSAPNATATCSGVGVCGLAPIPCSAGTADCDNDWSCETTTATDPQNCGGCGIVCPGAPNATATCSGNGVCGLTKNACAPGTADCSGDWTCETPILNDPHNCGGCGISCYGGTCSNGQCTNSFSLVSDFSGEADTVYNNNMVVGNTYVYWLTTTELRRAPKAGGSHETVATFAGPAFGSIGDASLVLDGSTVYWASSAGISMMPEAGGTKTLLTSATPVKFVVSSGKLYWNDSDVLYGTGLCSGNASTPPAEIRDCNAHTIVTFFVFDIPTRATTTWQTTYYEYGQVLGVVGGELFVKEFRFTGPQIWDFDGGILALDATTGAYLRAMNDVIDGQELGSAFGEAVFTPGQLIYTSSLGPGYPTMGVVALTPPSQPLHNRKVSGAVSYTSTFAADSTHGYYHRGGVKHPLTSVSLADGSETVLFGDTGNGLAMATDATYVYWTVETTGGEKAILRAAK